ncbi:MAG: hypothetical protein AVO35_11285 [Candidatus Aegiribacteria sp. MLS_C]|nr:MAG: hypothetical protein AVO35_11285 [Candidatus Aegiribacteria sp. MLS_C]
MKREAFLGAAVLLVVTAGTAVPSIIDLKTLEIDLSNHAEAIELASWSDPEIITITAEGLGWDGDPQSIRNGWVRTRPMALGLSWRAPAAVHLSVALIPAPGEVVLDNGQTITPYRGDIYVRYSADMNNWSSWQVLNHGTDPAATRPDQPGSNFYVYLRVPALETDAYSELIAEYAEMEVPWKSDEDAACRWLEQEHPGFFSSHIPFIGYVEFLYEGPFHGGRRLTSLRAEAIYSMSGIHYPPDDPGTYEERDASTWSFHSNPEQ